MQFLWNNPDFDAAVADLLESCEHARWAVAWATTSAPRFKQLRRNREKIYQLTVGTQFYQTDPEFIAAFNEHPNAGFVLETSGVFQPKVYYFEHGNGHWDCVVGSLNFTDAAFSRNSEAALRINQDDADAESTRKEITAALDKYQRLGNTLTSEELEEYREEKKRAEKNLPDIYNMIPSSGRSPKAPRPHDVGIINEGWEKFFQELNNNGKRKLMDRLKVMEEAATLFREHPRFSDFDYVNRQRIAGFVSQTRSEKDELDWSWFGNMRAAGNFKQAINRNNQRISDALDHIPLEGPVERSDFEAFVDLFRSSFKNAGVVTATRLLAMKRPDNFVCFNMANKISLCEALDIPKIVSLDNYWSLLIDPIQDSNWWNSPEPSWIVERNVWRCRVAMLDARFVQDDRF